MSNVLTQGGLRLYGAVSGAGQGLEQCIVLSGDSVTVGIGDPVTISAAGAAAVGSGPIKMAVKRANGTTDPIYGTVISTVPVIEGTGAVNFGCRYRLASTAQYIMVRPASNQDLYEICDDGSGALTAANIGNNAQITSANCDTTTGMSKFMLKATSAASGNATYPLHIVDIVQDATNDVTSINCRWVVALNNIVRAGGTGTVGT